MPVAFATPVQGRVDAAPAARMPAESFKFPDRQPGEQEFDYVLTIKPDAPFDYVHPGGIDFQKFLLDPDLSLVGHEHDIVVPRFSVRRFTEAEAEALRAYYKDTQFNVPRRRNPNFKAGNGEPEWLPPKIVNLRDYLVLQKKSEFLHAEYQEQLAKLMPAASEQPPAQDVVADFKRELYEQQGKPVAGKISDASESDMGNKKKRS